MNWYLFLRDSRFRTSEKLLDKDLNAWCSRLRLNEVKSYNNLYIIDSGIMSEGL